MSYKVLVTSRSFGQLSQEPLQLLEKAGFHVDFMTSEFDLDAFEKALPGYDALIIGAHPLTPECLRKSGQLKIVCKHGVGLDNIPLDVAKRQGIHVTNVPNANGQAVADLAFGLLLCCARQIVYAVNALRDGQTKPVIGTDAYEKTLGLLGFGHIARNVAQRAKGFRMRVLAYDPYITQQDIAKEYPFVTLLPLERVVEESDYISLHLPLTKETRGMFGKDLFSRMGPDAYLINTSRGGIVDEEALFQAVSARRIAGAALDVTEQEPIPRNHALLSLPEVIITNHIGMYSREAVNNVSMVCARNVVAEFAQQPLCNGIV